MRPTMNNATSLNTKLLEVLVYLKCFEELGKGYYYKFIVFKKNMILLNMCLAYQDNKKNFFKLFK